MTSEVVLAEDETAGSLHDKLADMGGPLLLTAMEALETAEQMEELQRFGFCSCWTLMICPQVLLIFLRVLLPHSRYLPNQY